MSESGKKLRQNFSMTPFGTSARNRILNVVKVKGLPIFKQLQIEEALFRVADGNWFIWNEEIEDPAIVLGISGKPSLLVDIDRVCTANMPLIKRFSGGGTVIVDRHTVFSSLICSVDDFPHVQPYPRHIMNWTGQFYDPIFKEFSSEFRLREDDYLFGEHKIGGNAQSKTSFCVPL